MKAGITTAKERSSGWRFIACLILISFTLQSYITQTHIHNVAPAVIAKTVSHAPGKAPVDDNPMDCPFCQAVAHDGMFFIPTSPLLFLSAVWIEMTALDLWLAASSGERAHNWQSRAPPLH